MAKEVDLGRRAAVAAALRSGRQTLDHHRRMATIAALEVVAEVEVDAAVSIFDAVEAHPENATMLWLRNRYFKD